MAAVQKTICPDKVMLHVCLTSAAKHTLWHQQSHRIKTFWQSCADGAIEATEDRGECPVRDLGYGSEGKRIQTVIIFKDPSDWYVDLQVITDICVGGEFLPVERSLYILED